MWVELGNEYRYMKAMDLGVLSDMPNIRTKACQKLFKQQVLTRYTIYDFHFSFVFLIFILYVVV